jgi:hypothetical protein
MVIRPIEVASLFGEDELAKALFFLTQEKDEARELAQLMKRATGGSVFEQDDIFFLLLAVLSDDAATRVGQLRDQTPDEAIAWRDAFIAEHGHPSTWEVEREEEEDLLE